MLISDAKRFITTTLLGLFLLYEKGIKSVLKNIGPKCWDEGVVTDLRPEPRSYVVRNAHGFVRRNRKHLYETPQFLRVSNRYDHIIDYDDIMQHNTSNVTSAMQERDDRPTSSSSLSAMPPRTSA